MLVIGGRGSSLSLSLDPPMSLLTVVGSAWAVELVAGRGWSCDLAVGGVPLVLRALRGGVVRSSRLVVVRTGR